MRKTKELSGILAPLQQFYSHANDECVAAEDCLVFCRISPGIYIVHYFAPLSKLLEWEEERQRAIQGVREVVETASDKMSMAPELNPGD